MNLRAPKLFFIAAILIIILPVSGNTINVDVITQKTAMPGDTVSFIVLVENLAPVVLDHCNYIFSVSPFVDIIRDCFGNSIDEALHVNELFDCLAVPPEHGKTTFFSVPVLGKIRADAPESTVITSSFSIDTISDEGPDGESCPGCWADSATGSNTTVVAKDPVPAPEFPAPFVPGLILGIGCLAVLWVRTRE